MTTIKEEALMNPFRQGRSLPAAYFCDLQPRVTELAPGSECDAGCAVTAAQPIISVTCTFPGGKIAVVQVYGAADEAQAVSVVERRAFPGCHYIAEAGDPTAGRAEPFYLWVCDRSDTEGGEGHQG